MLPILLPLLAEGARIKQAVAKSNWRYGSHPLFYGCGICQMFGQRAARTPHMENVIIRIDRFD